MARDIPISNGKLLICFDREYRIRDLYFPHVGQENHACGYPFRFGIWVDGRFSWFSDNSWHKQLNYLEDSLVTDVTLQNHELGLEVRCSDFVDYRKNFHGKTIKVKNLRAEKRHIKVFFHQDFRIYGSEVGDTGFYEPNIKAVVHYKGNRYFLSSVSGGTELYSIGAKAHGNAEGTWRDAEDGHLQNTAITHGSVDSTIGKEHTVAGHGEWDFEYWLCAGKDFNEVKTMHESLLAGSLKSRLLLTHEYWKLWVNKEDFDLTPLPEWAQKLFKRSLLIVSTQVDHEGAILAANDSEIQAAYKDHYSYLWPRDGALVANALDQAGYRQISQRFFHLLVKLIQPEGYFLHKYNPRGELASSWHPWLRNGKPQLPIQEDETALVLWALSEHFDLTRDVEFIREMYETIIIKAGRFLASYRDAKTGLPLPSYDLWEERKGIMTFTCCTVESGLRVAAKFAQMFGEVGIAAEFALAASEVKAAIEKHLYDPVQGRYLRGLIHHHDNTDELVPDATVDASLFALFRFGTFSVKCERVRSTMRAYRDKLWVKTHIGGIARYQHDWYQAGSPPTDQVPGNPWVISTLWLMMEEIFGAELEDELSDSLKYLEWVHRHALPSGVLAEQIDPYTGAPISVSPLTWSHATVIDSVMLYLRKLSELRRARRVPYSLKNGDRLIH